MDVYNQIQAAFTVGMKERYQNIFNQYYPAHNSTGFTERNLSCNFSEALLAELKDETAFVWYEAPLPITEKGKCQHIDAVVFSSKTNSVFFIESKRLGDKPTGKIEDVLEDINRLLDTKEVFDIKSKKKDKKFTNRGYILEEWYYNNKLENQYVICLMDFWVEKENYKLDIKELIISKNKSEQFSPEKILFESIGDESFKCSIDKGIDKAVRKYSIHLAAIKI